MMLLAIPLNAKKSSTVIESDLGFAETVRLAAGHKSLFSWGHTDANMFSFVP